MGWKIPEIKIRVPEVRVPKAKAARVMPKPRVKKSASGKIDGFSLTVFSSNRISTKSRHIDVIRELIASGGNRAVAAKSLGLSSCVISHHAKKIRHLQDADLQRYADELKTTADEIKRVCADLNPAKGVTHIDIIRELLAFDGSRSAAARNLGIHHSAVTQHAKNIRNLPDGKLREYSDRLKTTADEIKRVCADFNPRKGITYVDTIRELLASGGNKTTAAEKLGINFSGLRRRVKNLRRLSDADLKKYADELKTTVDEIKRVCADFDNKKGLTHIDIIGELLASGGSRRATARNLGVSHSVISLHAKNIRRLPDAKLQKYATQLNTTVSEIRRVCANLERKKGVNHIDIIRELLASGGSRTIAAQKLKVRDGDVSHHAKNIRHLTDEELQKYANQLNTAVGDIRRVCADFDPAKGITHIDVIRELIAANGNRTIAARNLGINQSAVSQQAKKLRRLTDAQLQKYAAELKTTVSDIRRVCADFTGTKGITHINIILALLASGGNRTQAAANLGINQGIVSYHAKNIKRLPDAQLQKYAAQLSKKLHREITIHDIQDVINPRTIRKVNFEQRVQVISELLASDGNRITAAQGLGLTCSCVSYHAKNIRLMPDAQMQKYADKLNTTIAEIRRVCADFGPTKGVSHIEIIRELIALDGDRRAVAQRLGINNTDVSYHARNIRNLTDAQLQKYADKLNITAAQIRRVCANLDSIKGIKHTDIIRELIASDGNRITAAQNLGIGDGVVSRHAKNIRQMSDADLKKYADNLNTTVAQIRRVCADFGLTKGITHIQIIRELLAFGGNRRIIARKLGIGLSSVNQHLKNIMRLSEAELAQYAAELGVSVERIKQVCAPRLEQAKKLFKK